MRILYDNQLFKASSLVCPTENANSPASNLIDQYLKKRFNSIGNSCQVTAVFDEAVSISSFAIGEHNISAGELKAYDLGDTLLGTVALCYKNNRDMCYFTQIDGVRKIVFDFATTDFHVKIGGISVGNYIQYPYMNPNPEIGRVLSSVQTSSTGGQINGRLGVMQKTPTINIETLDYTLIAETDAMIQNNQTVLPLWLDMFEESHNLIQPMYAVYNTSTVPVQKTSEQGLYYDLTLQFKEIN